VFVAPRHQVVRKHEPMGRADAGTALPSRRTARQKRPRRRRPRTRASAYAPSLHAASAKPGYRPSMSWGWFSVAQGPGIMKCRKARCSAADRSAGPRRTSGTAAQDPRSGARQQPWPEDNLSVWPAQSAVSMEPAPVSRARIRSKVGLIARRKPPPNTCRSTTSGREAAPRADRSGPAAAPPSRTHTTSPAAGRPGVGPADPTVTGRDRFQLGRAEDQSGIVSMFSIFLLFFLPQFLYVGSSSFIY